MSYEELQDPYGKRFWPKFRGRDGCRTPIPWLSDTMHAGFSEAKPWLPVAMEHVPMAVSVQDADPDSMLAFYRRMLAWRKTQPALAKGDFTLHETTDSVISYVRGHGNRLGLLRLQSRRGAGDRWHCLRATGARSRPGSPERLPRGRSSCRRIRRSSPNGPDKDLD